ncbi:hypothetical protein DXC89_02315 [Prevotella disiens]|uniref:Uncharacterized protein n=1 Tax=Prevotella disiens TaxID=28130 RepID=A0A3E4QM35_9BACT|nr:hypothetical protein DXC89_02315 [Prevotella disiens]
MLKMWLGYAFGYAFGYAANNEMIRKVMRLVIHFLVFALSYPPPVWLFFVLKIGVLAEKWGVFANYKGGVWQVKRIEYIRHNKLYINSFVYICSEK